MLFQGGIEGSATPKPLVHVVTCNVSICSLLSTRYLFDNEILLAINSGKDSHTLTLTFNTKAVPNIHL